MSFELGQKVDLFIENEKVGWGIVQNIMVGDLCHGRSLPLGHVVVLLQEDLRPEARLPFPHMDATTVGDCVGTFAIWSESNLVLRGVSKNSPSNTRVEVDEGSLHNFTIPRMRRLSLEPDHDDIASPVSLDLVNDGPTIHIFEGLQDDVVVMEDNEGLNLKNDGTTIHGIAVPHDDVVMEDDEGLNSKNDQSMEIELPRDQWRGQHVIVMGAEGKVPLFNGRVAFSSPNKSINGKALGVDNVAIMVSHSMEGSSESLKQEFPEWVEGSPLLLSWPTKWVILKGGTKSLFELGGTSKMVEENSQCIQDRANVKPRAKRSYLSEVRPSKKVRRGGLTPKDALKLSEEAVLSLNGTKCCIDKCMDKLTDRASDRADVLKVREEFYGQSPIDRHTFIYDTLWGLDGDNLEGSKMVLNRMRVCQKAWYQAYGIPESTFFRHKAKCLKDGVKVGFHGNSGKTKWKPHVQMAHAFIKAFVEINAERMPNKTALDEGGERVCELRIPACYKQVDILHEINAKLKHANFKEMSQPRFSQMWSQNFKHVKYSTNNVDFTKCQTCVSIMQKLQATKIVEERRLYELEREEHMHHQQSRRSCYYANRELSLREPENYLCVIHDKMDQAKTHLPRMNPPAKIAGMRAIPLPISMTGMLTHGAGPSAYGHFVVPHWPLDSNYTISSLAKCLRDLETFDGDRSGYLSFVASPATRPLHRALLDCEYFCNDLELDGKSMEMYTLPHGKTAQLGALGYKPLPKILLLQMDNCWKENKNRWILTFCSHLVAKGVFQMVHLGFLLVGHTHEDVDAFFSRYSEKLRKDNVLSMPHLMSRLFDCLKEPPIPMFIEEVADYKQWTEKFIPSGKNKLVGHTSPCEFRFLLMDGFPVMQYRHEPQESWRPPRGIDMWNRDNDGKAVLPIGEPQAVPIYPYLKDNAEVVQTLQKYNGYFEKMVSDVAELSDVRKRIIPTLKYWEKVCGMLRDGNDVESSIHKKLQQGFWPQTLHVGEKSFQLESHASSSQQIPIHGNVQRLDEQEDSIDKHIYVGPECDKPSTSQKASWLPHVDIEKDMFLLIRPARDWPKECVVWLGLATSNIEKDKCSENYGKVKVQYWAPTHKKKEPTIAEQYMDCWTKTWRQNMKDPPRWEDIGSVIFSWRMKEGKDGKIPNQTRIPFRSIKAAQDNLALTSSNEDRNSDSD